MLTSIGKQSGKSVYRLTSLRCLFYSQQCPPHLPSFPVRRRQKLRRLLWTYGTLLGLSRRSVPRTLLCGCHDYNIYRIIILYYRIIIISLS